MMISRIITTLNSKRGEKLITFVLCTSCVGFPCSYFIPNTFLIGYVQSFYEMHRNKEPVPVEDDILVKFEEVKNDIKEHLPPRAKAKPFTTSGFDLVSAGYVNTFQGAIIGIPSTFGYKNLNDVDGNPVLVEGIHLNSDLPAVQKLKSSLLLSDDAKKYAICHEILSANTPQMYLQTFYPTIIMISLNCFSDLTKRFLGIHNKPPLIKGLYYTIVTVLGFTIWIALKDNTSLYYDREVENQICSLGQNYINGGLEYCTKRLERNKALRELLSRGSSTYTDTGNENILFRNKTFPLTVKQQFLKKNYKM